MNVISDILPKNPNLQSAINLRMVFSGAPPKHIVLRARPKRKTVPIETCVFSMNEQVHAKCRAVDQAGTDRMTFRRAAHRNFTRQFSIRDHDCIHCMWLTQVGPVLTYQVVLLRIAPGRPRVPDEQNQTFNTFLHLLQFVYLFSAYDQDVIGL